MRAASRCIACSARNTGRRRRRTPRGAATHDQLAIAAGRRTDRGNAHAQQCQTHDRRPDRHDDRQRVTDRHDPRETAVKHEHGTNATDQHRAALLAREAHEPESASTSTALASAARHGAANVNCSDRLNRRPLGDVASISILLKSCDPWLPSAELRGDAPRTPHERIAQTSEPIAAAPTTVPASRQRARCEGDDGPHSKGAVNQSVCDRIPMMKPAEAAP